MCVCVCVCVCVTCVCVCVCVHVCVCVVIKLCVLCFVPAAVAFNRCMATVMVLAASALVVACIV